MGPDALLGYLESCLGLPGAPKDNDYLRIEQYRQALQHYLEAVPDAFFALSFAADPFAAATQLLALRDELLLSGWDFSIAEDVPARLACLAAVEAQLQARSLRLVPGYADRFCAVLATLGKRDLPLQALRHHEPMEWLPVHFQRLLSALRASGVAVSALAEAVPEGESDLAQVQRALLAPPGEASPKIKLRQDGSLLLLRGQRDTHLASYTAQLLRQNPAWQPSLLVQGASQVLGHALALEGLPNLGLLSASLARPTLQVLKLATVFLWKPIDPYKVMEFVSLAVKPLERELANRIAALMANKPGLFSDAWRGEIAQYFEVLRQREVEEGKKGLEERANYQYGFWFRRPRYDISGTAPKAEAVKIFNYLSQWAHECYEDEGSRNASLLVLSQQARRIKELLEALPEEQLTSLELERIVRTIYEPAPVQLARRECGFLRYTTQPGAIIAPVSDLLCWNFVQSDQPHFFSRWYAPERRYLEGLGLQLASPAQENGLQLWQRRRPLLNAQRRLVLVLPDFINGQATNAHPLMGDLEAACENLADITFQADDPHARGLLSELFELPAYQPLALQQLGQPKPFLKLQAQQAFLEQREEESFSSLNDLFYYPYKWVFRHRIRLRQTDLLSIVRERTLLGNLAHRFFEELLSQEGCHAWGQQQVYDFLTEQENELLQKEGAVLLLYGKEPERLRFIEKVKRSAWNLIRHLQENGWTVAGTEERIEGEFAGLKLTGFADVLLRRGQEQAVLDLKWSGASYRESLIRNEEDLQLVLYSRMIGQGQGWAHTAYYIIEKEQLIARNNQAFQAVEGTNPDTDLAEINQRILRRMEATYRWRVAQLKQGLVEVRCAQTLGELEDAYADEPLLDLLEMQNDDAKFDDYRALINLLK